jgi:hypothetical protein
MNNKLTRKPKSLDLDIPASPVGIKQFKECRKKWEKSLEDIILSASGSKRDDGLKILINHAPIIAAFNEMAEKAEKELISTGCFFIPGDINNEY